MRRESKGREPAFPGKEDAELREVHIGSCPTCGAMVQIVDEGGTTNYRHVDLSAVWLRKYRAEVTAAVERVGRLDFTPRDLVEGGCVDMGGDSIGSRIAALRKHGGWTQSEIAASSGVSVPYLSEIENDKRNPSAGLAAAIAEALGTSLDYLVRGPRS